MLIAQLSDLHLTAPEQLAQGTVSTFERLDAVLESINDLESNIDAVLITGDLADNKHPDAYQQLAERLKTLDCPFYLIPGNHDDRALMRHYFPDHIGFGGQGDDVIQYSVDDYPVRMIALDTTIPGEDIGELCSSRLNWLANKLAEQPDKSTLIFMHHPPFITGILETDSYGLFGIEEFKAVIEKHSQVIRIICGHVHRNIITSFAGVTTSIVPAVSFTQALNFTPESKTGFFVAAPKYELHWLNNGEFVSHTISLEACSQTIPYPIP